MRGNSFVFNLGVLVLVGVLLMSGFFYFKHNSKNDELAALGQQLKSLESEVLKYENEDLISAVNAKKAALGLSSDKVLWSEIVEIIRDTIPKVEGKPLVEILSYSGSGNNDLNMSVKTVGAAENPYFDVAKLIETFDASENFEGTFIPSISNGVNEEGQVVLSFSLSTSFVKEKEPLNQADFGETLDEILQDSLKSEKTPITR